MEGGSRQKACAMTSVPFAKKSSAPPFWFGFGQYLKPPDLRASIAKNVFSQHLEDGKRSLRWKWIPLSRLLVKNENVVQDEKTQIRQLAGRSSWIERHSIVPDLRKQALPSRFFARSCRRNGVADWGGVLLAEP